MSFGIGKKYCRIKCICLFFLFIICLPVFSVNQENTLTEKKMQPYMVFTINSVEHSLFGTIVKYNVSYSENFPFGSSFVECYRDSKGYSVVNKVNLSFNMEFYFGYLIIPNDRMMLALQFGKGDKIPFSIPWLKDQVPFLKYQVRMILTPSDKVYLCSWDWSSCRDEYYPRQTIRPFQKGIDNGIALKLVIPEDVLLQFEDSFDRNDILVFDFLKKIGISEKICCFYNKNIKNAIAELDEMELGFQAGEISLYKIITKELEVINALLAAEKKLPFYVQEKLQKAFLLRLEMQLRLLYSDLHIGTGNIEKIRQKELEIKHFKILYIFKGEESKK